MSPTAPAVRVEHLSKTFGPKRVLDDVSFDVSRGTSFCLLGRSGTGKSVTLKHIIGLLRPDAGRVLIDGKEIGAMDRAALSDIRRGIGFVFQNAALFDSITVGQNVAFPLRRHTDWPEDRIAVRVRETLEQVGLEAEFKTMPADLSGGMRKRAGLARALVLDPALLLVDEPSAALDPLTAMEINRLLLDLKQRAGTTLVVVTHDVPGARTIGDVLAVIDEGRLIASGTADELASSDHPLVRTFMADNAGGRR